MNSKNLKTSLIAFVIFILLFGYNNCQPMGEPVATFANGSLGGAKSDLQKTQGEIFFSEKLVPKLEVYCSSCHNDPNQVSGISAPLTIFNYTFMKNKVSSGTSNIDNYFINKAMNIEGHAGGSRCSGGATSTPCKEISEWVSIEFPSKSVGFVGEVKSVSSLGRVEGYAYKPSVESNVYDVFILNNLVDQGGQIVAQIPANEQGSGTGVGHYFSFDLPIELKDGIERELYVYVDSVTEENLIPNMPFKYVAYAPRSGGEDFFNTNVAPSLNQCSACHTWDYKSSFTLLLDPTPFDGGTNLTNTFIKNANGELDHAEGSYCGGDKNSGLCAAIRDWWDYEFAP